MAFLDTNAVARGNETVDTKFSPMVEANLWPGNIFQPGLTFTDKYQTDSMGQLFVRRLGKGTVDRSTDLTFTHNQTADDLISIVLDESFKQSEAIYQSVEIARTSGMGAQKMDVVSRNVAAEWQKVAHEKLVDGGTVASNTTATTDETFKEQFIASRKELRENDANPDVCLLSTDQFANVLNFSGREYTPNSNDEVLRTGALGRFFGLNIYESTQLAIGDNTNVEWVMYEHEAYSILTQLIASRIIDAGKDWAGSAAQVELKSGFKVTTPERVLVKTVVA